MNDRIEQVIFYTIDRTYRKKQTMAQRMFAETGIDISPEQWVLLKIVTQYDGISQVDLAQKAVKDTASITRILDILQKKALLTREQDANDRRKYLVTATKTGKEFIERHMDSIINIRKQALKGISKTELDTLRALLEKMQKNMD